LINFNGGTVGLGTSLSPLGMYAGYLLIHSGNFWMAIGFLILAAVYFVILVASLCRFIINSRRNAQLRALRHTGDNRPSYRRAVVKSSCG